jgi:hypothetical protein
VLEDWFLFVGKPAPSVIEEKGEGFENGKKYIWLSGLAFNLN